MKTVICDISAIEMWNRGLCKDAKPSKMKRLENCASVGSEIPLDTLRSLGLSMPVHVMAARKTPLRTTANTHCHTWNSNLPVDSVVRLDEGIYVAKPEMCFYMLSLSRKASLVDLIAFGDELSGLYATIGCLPGKGHAGYDFLERPPLSSPEKLARFLARAALTKRSKAMRAAQHVVGRSRSPMETVTQMLLCLPPHLGGYGFPRPLMNVSFKLPPHLAKLSEFDKIRPDLYWPDAKIAIEYKGEADHSSVPDRTKDAVRENLMQHKGITVISITKAQFASTAGMYAVAKQLADKMGRRINLDHLSAEHTNLHMKLCDIAKMRPMQ